MRFLEYCRRLTNRNVPESIVIFMKNRNSYDFDTDEPIFWHTFNYGANSFEMNDIM